MYFAPSCHPERQHLYTYVINDDAPLLDPAAILAEAWEGEVPVVRASRTEPLRTTDLRRLQKKLTASKSAHTAAVGRAIRAVCDGEPWAAPGSRDTTLFNIAGAIAAEFPEMDPVQTATLFQGSIDAIALRDEKDPIPLSLVEDKLERALCHHEEEVAVQEQEDIDARRSAIRKAFDGARESPYTDEEIARWAREAGYPSVRDFNARAWIIQSDKIFYVFLAGDYIRLTLQEYPSLVGTYLAPAPLELYAPTSNGAGVRLKAPHELVADHGSHARRIVADLSAQRARFDHTTGTMVEATAPLRKLTPQYDPEVAEWLVILGGDAYDHLVDWLSLVTDTTEPLPALYLDGVPGAGKTLLANGLARLWTEMGPSDMGVAMGSFNGAVAACPLILADETLPKNFRGHVKTQELRAIVQERVRPWRRKYMADGTLEGAVRVIITSNNENLLLSNETLTRNDIQAISDRLIHVHASEKSAEYLRGADTAGMIYEDKIARHALYLAQGRRRTRRGRFAVPGFCPSLIAGMTTGSGLRSAVCHALTQLVLGDARACNPMRNYFWIRDGHLLVSPKGLTEHWECFRTNEPPPTIVRVGNALKGLSWQKTQIRFDNTRRWVWMVKTENLVAWAEDQGVADARAIKTALGAKEGEKSKERMTGDMIAQTSVLREGEAL